MTSMDILDTTTQYPENWKAYLAVTRHMSYALCETTEFWSIDQAIIMGAGWE